MPTLDMLARRFDATVQLARITGKRWAYVEGPPVPEAPLPPQRVPLDDARGLIVYRAEPLTPAEQASLCAAAREALAALDIGKTLRGMGVSPMDHGQDARATDLGPLDRAGIEQWLRETDPDRLASLWQAADTVRQATVGNGVHLRGLIEMSNYCVRRCAYCGLHAGNRKLVRYRMTDDEVLDCARQAVTFGYGTVVIQTGEDYGIPTERISRLVRAIKQETPLAVTLSLGERGDDELAAWKAAGADRYLLRFETSNPSLFDRIHPRPPGAPDRLALLRSLRVLGYEVGSGVMIGIPGQRWDDLVDDLLTFRSLDLDMIGVGPWLSHPETAIGADPAAWMAPADQQVPNTEDIVYRVIALSRLLCPAANIPATSALATINTVNGREQGLQRGANILMPNLTPITYRALYQIYPGKACIDETGTQCNACMRGRIGRIGRHVGSGRGDAPNRSRREKHP